MIEHSCLQQVESWAISGVLGLDGILKGLRGQLVSEYKIGNLYTDRLGISLKEITKISKENWLTINGKAIRLDNMFFEIPK